MHFRRTLEFGPTLAEAHSNLGQPLLELSLLDEVLDHCREAVRLRPGFPEAHLDLGRVLPALGRTAEAETSYAEALRLDPERAVACHDMGQIAHDEGKLQESLAWYDRSLSLDLGFALAHADRGVVLAEQGDLEAAEESFRAALVDGSGQVEAHYQLANLLGDGLLAADLATMRELSATPWRSDDARSTVHSALALVLDALGHFAAQPGTCALPMRSAWRTGGDAARPMTPLSMSARWKNYERELAPLLALLPSVVDRQAVAGAGLVPASTPLYDRCG